jgi:vitamin B12 transporter
MPACAGMTKSPHSKTGESVRILVILIWFLSVLLLLIVANFSHAEEARLQLPDVVITATRTETDREDVPASITTVSDEQLRQQGQMSTADALRGTPGVDVVEFGSPGQPSFLSIRGAAPDQVLVLVDGVEVNAPTTGQFDFANVPTDNLERLEVLRGAGGALYGAQAIGGVVNLLTRRGEGPWRYSLAAEGGSGNTHREVIGLHGSHGLFGLSGTISFLDSDGFRRVNDHYRNLSTVWRADLDLLPKGTLRGFLRYTNAQAGLPNFNITENRLDPDARSRSDFFLAKGEWAHSLSDRLNYRVSASFVRDNYRYRDFENDEVDGANEEEKRIPAVRAHFPTEILAVDTQWDYRWRDIALTTVGFEFKERSARIFKSQFDDEEQEYEVERFKANRSNAAVYIQEHLWGFDDTVHAIGGLRYDHYDRFGDEVTLSGSGSYLVQATGTRFRLNYAEGFRAPTFDELFEPSLGNPRLRPERSWEISAGLSQEFFDGRLSLEPTYFYRHVTNLIEEVADQLPGAIHGLPEEGEEDQPLTRNLNARLQGLEFAGVATPIPWLTIRGSYTYLNFHTPTGTLLNRPHHRGSLFTTLAQNNLFQAGDNGTLSLLLYAVGPRDSANPREEFESEKIAGYVRTDVAVSYRFAGLWSPLVLHATARNLFDHHYSESFGFRTAPFRFLIGFRYELG